MLRSEIDGLLRDEKGAGMIQVIMLGALLSLMALYFANRTVSFEKDMNRIRSKDQIVTDRNLLKFEMLNRRFPDPTP